MPSKGTIMRMRGFRGERLSSAARVADHAEARLVDAFGADSVERGDADGTTRLRRIPSGHEPLLLLVVDKEGRVTVRVDDYEHDGDWQAALDTLHSPQVMDVHGGDGWIHCFALDGPGGPVLFTNAGEPGLPATRTEEWLRGLDGWSGAR